MNKDVFTLKLSNCISKEHVKNTNTWDKFCFNFRRKRKSNNVKIQTRTTQKRLKSKEYLLGSTVS